MKKIYLIFLLVMLASLASLNSTAQCCDDVGYATAGPCLTAVCADDSFCCDSSWDSVCASEAVLYAECAACLCGCYDNDLDGITNCDGDCDDFDEFVNPGAIEIDANGIDDDCDGQIDFNSCCDDLGYASPGACTDAVCASDSFCCDVAWDSVCASEAAAAEECQSCICGCYDNDLDGYTNCDGDCDDFNLDINPGAAENCDNGIDDDCDGTIDLVVNACDQPGYSLAGACTDAVCAIDSFCCNSSWDSVCASEAASIAECQQCLCGCYDNDLDGFTNCDGDCDDFDASVNPDAIEVCNGVDDDCNGSIDENAVCGTVNVTFSVNMQGLTIAPDGVLIALSTNGYSETYMTDLDLDGIYETTQPIPANTAFTYIYGNGIALLENVPIECGVDIGFGFILRPLSVANSDIDLETVCFSNCSNCVPLNDLCDDATPISCGSSVSGYTTSATMDAAVVSCDGFSVTSPGVWYTLTGDGNVVELSTCGGPDVIADTKIHVYSGDCSNPICVAANDDDCDGPAEFLSTISFLTTNSTQYYVLVSEFGLGVGVEFTLNMTCSPPPANDNCGDAILLSCGDVVTGTTIFSSADVDAITCQSEDVTSPGVWYVIEGTGGDIILSSCSSTDGDTKIHVYTGDCSGLICETANDDDCGLLSTVNFTSESGTQYYVLVSEYDLGEGIDFILEATCICEDLDLDGFTTCDGDCDDSNATINPAAIEVCNAIDDNCDGSIDEGLVFLTYYEDNDGDGYGSTLIGDLCSAPANSSTIDGDCDDSDAGINPSASEVCNGIDDNCDGNADEGLAFITYYEDIDGDGYGAVLIGDLCSAPANSSSIDGDCDDSDAGINPSASEVCNDIDDNCDGNVDEGLATTTYYADADGDGYGASMLGDFCSAPANSSTIDGDCDDSDSDVNPDATEVDGNGIDDDCDGEIDFPSSCCDEVGYGEAGACTDAVCAEDSFCCNVSWDSVCASEAAALEECQYCICGCYDNDLDGFTNCDGDCDDFNSDINPDAVELCNGIDDNCDGSVDEGLSLTYYADADGDGYGSTTLGDFCTAPANSSTTDGDCDDSDANINPLAIEVCNGIDDNCDGNIDEGLATTTYYADADGDGYGSTSLGDFCSAPANSSTNDSDCDDSDANINPLAIEVCNGIDDNCDGNTDEGLATATYYSDADGDGYGALLLGDFCSAPANSSTTDGDCDDSDANINPLAIEVCNGTDDNCDGNIDEGLATTTYYADADGDGYGALLIGDFCSAPANSSTNDGDCDDSDFDVNPDATEVDGNGIDDDCDGEIDFPAPCCDEAGYGEAGACTDAVCAEDSFCCNVTWDSVCASEAAALEECQYCICGCYDNDLDGFTNCDGDCDDFNSDINPDATELCNGIDDNCDGSVDEGLALTYYADADGDGYGAELLGNFCSAPANSSTTDGDCDDTDASVNPIAVEVCNGIDDNCDGGIDEGLAITYYADNDGDGYGAELLGNLCSPPANSSTIDGDCDDTDASVNPVAVEVCNGIDDNCDGDIDEGLTTTYYADNDGDGYGAALLGDFCSPPANSSTIDGDCDDSDSDVNPDAIEVDGNGIDDDCDGEVDFPAPCCDEAGYGEAGACTDAVCAEDSFCCNVSWDSVCASEAAALEECQYCICGCYDNDLDGYTNCDGDCDDFNEDVNPDAIEIDANGIDDDCDGEVDFPGACCDEAGYNQAGPCTDAVCAADSFCCDVAWDSVCASEAAATEECQLCICGCYDNDLDGFTNCDGDCDDFDENVNPDADENCTNGIDDDCDGLVDIVVGACDQEGYNTPGSCLDAVCAEDSFCCDVEWDSVCASEAAASEACQECICGCYDNDLDGFTNCDGDCDDFDSTINPGATELCNGIDDNCNGTIDDGATGTVYYADLDADGFGSTLLGTFCVAPANSSTNNLDCNDANSAVNPSSLEVCNGLDDNCDGNSDEGLAIITYYEDADGDGYGATILGDFCSPPANSSTNSNDCDDTDSEVNPDAVEICNNIDDDCDGQTDEDLEVLEYFADVDADGFGGESLGMFCSQPAGSTLTEGDCDDFNSDIHPGASELCNGLDDDCDGDTDEDATGVEYFEDADADGYGSISLGIFCTQPDGSSSINGDCNDDDAAINPGAAEICNNIDDDCDGDTDENVVFSDYYLDSDGDGYGSVFLGNLCSQPANASLNDQDCDDTDAEIHPGATEQCNGIDDNCDGNTDEGLIVTYYADTDGDGYGNPDQMQMSCTPVSGFVINGEDCDDDDATVHPGAIEYCNDIDDDCDGTVDDNCIVSVDENAWNWYVNLYPNPASDHLTIQVDGTQGLFSYTIIDALGKIVMVSTLPSQNQTSTIDCSEMAQGTYTIIITQGSQVAYKKFIKM